MRLIIEDLEGATTVVNLDTEGVTTIGRTPANKIQLTEQNVSRSHAKITFRDDAWVLEDLGSYNGVRVNGIPIYEPTLLRESDLIQIGDYHLTLSDDVDRATVDIGPRGAANDGSLGGSSSELPSVSVDDLSSPASGMGAGMAGSGERRRAEPHANRRDDESSSKAGLIAGVFGLLALVGVGVWWFTIGNGGSGDGKNEVADSTPPAKPAEVVEPTTAAEPTTTADLGTGPAVEPIPDPVATGTGTEDTGAADDAAIAETDTGEPEPVPEPIPEPEKQPTKPKPSEPKPAAPKLPPDEALAAARKASLTGNNKQAYSLAKDAYDQNKSSEALSVMGVAACKMGSESKAKSAYAKMTDSKDKQSLEKICKSLGIELQ